MEQEIVYVNSAKVGKVYVDFVSVENTEKIDVTGTFNALQGQPRRDVEKQTGWVWFQWCGSDD